MSEFSKYYRDKNGLECDAVVHLRDGRYGLIEIKLGGEQLIAQGAATLKKLAAKIDNQKMNDPSFWDCTFRIELRTALSFENILVKRAFFDKNILVFRT